MSKKYYSIETFAGCGGMAIGMEMAGFSHIMLNDFDKRSTETLKHNRPKWNVVHEDIANVDFSEHKGKVDLFTGGFPCQAFSYAGKKQGLKDARGNLFLDFARGIDECQPKVFLAENVRGLLNHDGGQTIEKMMRVFRDLGYYVFEPKLHKAIHFRVPQKRERVFILGIRGDLYQDGLRERPKANPKIYTLKDALKKGELFSQDVPLSEGSIYNEKKKKVLDLVPPGRYWRDLPLEIQKEYMGKSFYLGGGKTGIARRISWDEPSLTVTCSPAQKQTERCHPDETRPFTVREYARIQTFPDEWEFMGPITQKYKQIGNAVPVNLAYSLGIQIKELINKINSLPKTNLTNEELQSLIHKGGKLIQARQRHLLKV